MNNRKLASNRTDRVSRQAGLTLVELSVTMTIALFLLAGLLTIVQNTRKNYMNENLLSQLQDQQRLAMTLLTDVIQQAGYFPDPKSNTLDLALPASAPFVIDQMVNGTQGASSSVPDTISVRFMTGPAGTDGLINCLGASNTAATATTYINAFSIIAGSVPTLGCAVNGGPITPLVSGVSNLQIWYGVKTTTTKDNNVDSYLRAGNMAAGNWTNVTSIRIQVTFVNPLAGQPGQPASINFERVIPIMNRTGLYL